MLGAHDRIELWREHLRESELDPEILAAHLALGPGQVRNVFKTAAASALLAGTAIRVTHENPVSALGPLPVKPVQIDVAQARRDHPALRGPGHATPDRPVLHHP